MGLGSFRFSDPWKMASWRLGSACCCSCHVAILARCEMDVMACKLEGWRYREKGVLIIQKQV